ncbi:MAG: NUDIX hydrolase [Paracoccaceae bacterium]
MSEDIRDAASVILVRHARTGPQVLMGLRGAAAVFMPSKYVFPGGGVDAADLRAAPDCLAPVCRARLAQHSRADLGDALANAALRELDEETGLHLAGPMRFMFRAITPPGRTRRFDARFFMADAAGLQNDADDFSRASGELSHLHWIALTEARSLPLPFITEVVLSEVQAVLNGAPDRPVPFFNHGAAHSNFLMLEGA